MAGIALKDAEAARLEITREQAAEVQKLYREVYKEYRKRLKGLTSGGATSSLRKSQLRKLMEGLKTAYESLGRQLEGNITSAVERTSQAVVDANTVWLSEAGLKIAGAYAHVPQDIVTLLASGKLYSDGWTLSKAIWGESQQKAHEIDLIVAKGVAANKSAYEIAKDLESYVNPGALKPWDWSKVYPGTSKKVDYNAQRLARTMVSHAYQQSLERACKKNPFVIGYKWRASHSTRTCELCHERSETDHHGLGVGVYPKGDLPLDHPNGMCTFLTVMSDSLKGISDRLADWANGKEDPELDGWFKAMGAGEGSSHPTQPVVPQVTPERINDLLSNQSAEFLAELNSRMHDWWASLTKEEREAVKNYTGHDFSWMNAALRESPWGRTKQILTWDKLEDWKKQQIRDAQSALMKYHTDRDMVVRRGSSVNSVYKMLGLEYNGYDWIIKNKDQFLNQVMTDKGFYSTSPLGGGGFQRDVDFRIFCPKDSTAPYVDMFSENRGEKETLLPAGGMFRLLDIRKGEGGMEVYMEYLGSDTPFTND